MEKEELEQLARQVLEAYERKDIVFFEAAFDDGVVLRDWNHEVLGKEAAIMEFKNNFDSARTLNMCVTRNTGREIWLCERACSISIASLTKFTTCFELEKSAAAIKTAGELALASI